MGRFTQVDPFDGALAVPASMNPYGYGHGSPVRYTDPSGEFVCGGLCVAAIIGAIAFGAYAYGSQVNANMQSGMSFGEAANPSNINLWKVGGAMVAGAVLVPLAYLAVPYVYVYATSTLPAYASYLYGAYIAPTALGLELTAATSLAGAIGATYVAPIMPYALPVAAAVAGGTYNYAYNKGWISPEVHEEVMLSLFLMHDAWLWNPLMERLYEESQVLRFEGIPSDPIAIIEKELSYEDFIAWVRKDAKGRLTSFREAGLDDGFFAYAYDYTSGKVWLERYGTPYIRPTLRQFMAGPRRWQWATNKNWQWGRPPWTCAEYKVITSATRGGANPNNLWSVWGSTYSPNYVRGGVSCHNCRRWRVGSGVTFFEYVFPGNSKGRPYRGYPNKTPPGVEGVDWINWLQLDWLLKHNG